MRKLILILSVLLFSAQAFSQGIPFMRNFTPDEYNAHNRSFDILVNPADGVVYAANFEGLLRYDGATWSVLHTPGITRLTKLYRDISNRIWVGGYNYFGYIAPSDGAGVGLVGVEGSFRGEVDGIWEEQGRIYFSTASGSLYRIENGKVVSMGSAPESKASEGEDALITKKISLADNFLAVAYSGGGVVFTEKSGKKIFSVTEDNGLCNNVVNSISYDRHGVLWGATDGGIFALAVPSAYSTLGSAEGLKGEVLSIELIGRTMYVGTLAGLFRKEGTVFRPVKGIEHACWSLVPSGGALMAATTDGVFAVEGSGSARKLSDAAATSVLPAAGGFYSGELDGFYFTRTSGSREKLYDLEKITAIVLDSEGALWVRNLYGQVAVRRSPGSPFETIGSDSDLFALVHHEGKVTLVDAENSAGAPFSYPDFSTSDSDGILWLTDKEGRNLYPWKDGHKLDGYDEKLHPVGDYAVRALLRYDGMLWIGTDNGLVVVDMERPDPLLSDTNTLYIRSSAFPSRKQARFTYSLGFSSLCGKTAYRYRLGGEAWSEWSSETEAVLNGLSAGSYRFSVQARDAKGMIFSCEAVEFTVPAPFYLKWYMIFIYALVLLLLGGFASRLRTRQLEKEKEKLEAIVQERTAELRQAQDELVHQEKMATAGKLTQGLIDRILNPVNYINNFSKLSSGLIDDLRKNIQSEKEKMDPDNYDDTSDILDMLQGNLEKVESHGTSTSRILKAMEEILRERTGTMSELNASELVFTCEGMLRTYYKEDIERFGIKISCSSSSSRIPVRGNSEQLSKSLMSLLGNGVHAVRKRAERGEEGYVPELLLSATESAGKVLIKVFDNGVGIEESILDRIFDPFFTTKTASEASGVGLYLTQEAIRSHGGKITVESVKYDHTEVTVELPIFSES